MPRLHLHYLGSFEILSPNLSYPLITKIICMRENSSRKYGCKKAIFDFLTCM